MTKWYQGAINPKNITSPPGGFILFACATEEDARKAIKLHNTDCNVATTGQVALALPTPVESDSARIGTGQLPSA